MTTFPHQRGAGPYPLPDKAFGAAAVLEAPQRRKRVYIVDDHRFFVAGLSSLINHSADLEVCGSASDGSHVVRDVRRLRPDLVIMDIKLPHTDGLTIARGLRRVFGDIPIVFISSLAAQRVRDEVAALGGLGFIEKTQAPARVLEEIHHALGL